MTDSLRWAVADATLELVQGDITRFGGAAVVNAANAQLAGGGGVDGAIHRAAGLELLQACQRIIAQRGAPLAPGEAVTTPGFQMRAAHVIHTVGPMWRGGNAGEEQVLRRAYASSLAQARECGAAEVAFPAISCGAYGYPVEQASRVALETLRQELEAQGPEKGPEKVCVYLFSRQSFELWARTAEEILGRPTP